mmetsp:Transcript_4337/g.7320  ORF Transcript_4337/g.7320 Transcript_4337/m.7320 type:complete len:95 (+) Transcript_4337:844-1128(+)
MEASKQEMTFTTYALLNQVLNWLDLEFLESEGARGMDITQLLTEGQIKEIQSLAYRYEQIELRDSMAFTKKNMGVDVSVEVVQALKQIDMNYKL